MDHIRPYTDQDAASCLALFDSNTPRFFTVGERSGFMRFLGRYASSWNFHVIERAGSVVACSGYAAGPGPATATLCWGMVDGVLHRQGLGTTLLMTRLDAIRRAGGIDEVLLDTSQHTQAFYSRFGFTVKQVTRGGYGDGLDRWDMGLSLSGTP